MREVSIKPFILLDRTCVLHIMDMLNTSPWYLAPWHARVPIIMKLGN